MISLAKNLLCLVGLSSTLVIAQPELDLAQLESLARSGNRNVLAARERVVAARSAVDSAAAWPNPELEYLSGQQRSRGVAGSVGDARSISLSQPIDLPWLRQPRIAAAEAGVLASQAENRAYEAEVLARLRLRFYESLRREAELQNAREDVRLMEGVRSRIALRVDLGEAPRYELIKADAEMLNARKVAQAAALRVEQAYLLLRQAVGADLPAGFTVKGNLREVPEPLPREALLGQLAASSPELARVRSELLRAEQLLAFESAQRIPKLALKAGVDEDPDVRATKLGVVLSIPLWDRRRGPVGEATAQVARARHEVAAAEFSLAQQMAVAFQQHEIAQVQVTALESGIVRQTENALRVAEAAYRFGERGFIDVLDAQRVHRAARGELIAARYELAAAWVEIERLRALPVESQK